MRNDRPAKCEVWSGSALDAWTNQAGHRHLIGTDGQCRHAATHYLKEHETREASLVCPTHAQVWSQASPPISMGLLDYVIEEAFV